MKFVPPIPYGSAKPENDPDLVQICRDRMLVLLGDDAVTTYFDGHKQVEAAEGQHSQIQRLFLTRWFVRQLMTAGQRTHDLRPQLAVDNVDLWVRVVEETIVPAMKHMGLPHTQI